MNPFAYAAPVLAAVAIAAPAIARAPAPPPLPADPISAIEGKWHDQHRKVEVTIRNGVVTVSKVETTAKFGVLPIKEGQVIARLSRGQEERGAHRFTGECVTGGYGGPNQQWVMADCGDFGPLLKPVLFGGKPAHQLGVTTLTLYRADVLGPDHLAGRK